MGRSPDFIGLGAQKAGTSWIYACLYEHPQVYAPVKEIHFFSRERNWSKGYEWYETFFNNCPPGAKTGEFSTSYLHDSNTPERIYRRYPHVKLLVSLRNPVARAYSNYINDIIAGKVSPEMSFDEALACHPEYLEQGYYASLLERYLQYFNREQILILIYEDGLKDPCKFIRSIYQFLEVNDDFTPSMLFRKVNPGRIPRSPRFEQSIDRLSKLLQNKWLQQLWWLGKKAGIGDKLRALNTRDLKKTHVELGQLDKRRLFSMFEEEIKALEKILGRELKEWIP